MYRAAMSRGQRARKYARTEFAFAVLYVILGAFLWMAAPTFSGGMHSQDTWWTMLPTAAVAGVVFGFAWMIRIYRTSFNPEPDHRSWRYRARGFLRR
jgi:DMSO reductase anchor subunit